MATAPAPARAGSRVSGLAAVAAQFAGATARPTPTPTSAVEPGGYSGQSQNGNGVTFSVPAGARSVFNFSLPGSTSSDVRGGGICDTLVRILKTAVRADGSFTAAGSQNGIVNGVKAKFTYSVSGRFEGKSATGAAAATGVYREDIVFADDAQKCTTNNQPGRRLEARRLSKGPIEPGTYSGQ